MKITQLNFYFALACLSMQLSLKADEVKANSPKVNSYKAKDFSSLLGSLPGLPDGLLKLHFKLYEGYVKNLNDLLSQLEECQRNSSQNSLVYGALKRRVGWEYDGMMLHELYFENMGSGRHEINKSHALYEHIQKSFGSFEAWKKDFLAMGLMRGIGWVVLYYDVKNGLLMNVWINEHDVGHLAGGEILLAMDVWEHAYITVYGLNRMQYLESFFSNIKWDVVEKRY